MTTIDNVDYDDDDDESVVVIAANNRIILVLAAEAAWMQKWKKNTRSTHTQYTTTDWWRMWPRISMCTIQMEKKEAILLKHFWSECWQQQQ